MNVSTAFFPSEKGFFLGILSEHECRLFRVSSGFAGLGRWIQEKTIARMYLIVSKKSAM
jgi:hypothetical protein